MTVGIVGDGDKAISEEHKDSPSYPHPSGAATSQAEPSKRIPSAAVGALVFVIAAAIAFGFTFLKYRYDPSTVLRDDGINEFTPYLIERGRLIAQGDWSVLTTNSLSGGNLLVDFGRSIFHPIIVALTLVATVIHEPLKLAMLFGALEMLSLMTGGYLLGRTVRLKHLSAMLLGMTLAFLPLNVALFTADHWNTGLGLSSFVWALALAIRAFQSPRALRLFALSAASWVVFATGWPFVYVVLALSLIALAVAWCRPFARNTGLPRRLLDTARIAFAVVLAFIAALPVFSEYAYLMPQLARNSTGVGNADNFGVPSLGQVLSVGNPVGGDWWNTFWGYVYWGIPIGFVTMLVWALFFKRFDRFRLASPEITATAAMTVLMLAATQLPTYMGPLRWTFRYVGYLAVFAALLIFMLIDRLEWRFSSTRAKAAALALCVGLVILASRIPMPTNDKMHALVLPLATLAVLIAALWLLRSRRTTAAVLCLVLGGTALSSFTAVTSKESFVQTLNMPAASTLDAYADELAQGYVLTVESDLPRGGTANLFENFNYGTRYLLFGQRVINGYDPVVQQAYQNSLKPTTSQGNLPNDAVAHLSQPVDNASGNAGETICRFDQYGIRSVLLQSSGGTPTADALTTCGFERVDGNDAESLYARRGLSALVGTATLADTGLSFSADELVSQQQEHLQVENANDAPATLHFARMHWPGYTATLNGRPLEVKASSDGVLVDVEIPADASGTLELRYAPVTWRFVVPAAITAAGLLVTYTIAGLFIERRHRHRDSDSARTWNGPVVHSRGR